MKKILGILALIMSFSLTAYAAKSVVVVQSVQTGANGTAVITYTASNSDRIQLPGLECAIDKTKGATQLNTDLKQCAVAALNADTPGTATGTSDIVLFGGASS